MQEPTAQPQGTREGSSHASDSLPQATKEHPSPCGELPGTGARRAPAGSQGRTRLLVAGAVLALSVLLLRLWSAPQAPPPDLLGKAADGVGLGADKGAWSTSLLNQESPPSREHTPTAASNRAPVEDPPQALLAEVRTRDSGLEPTAFQLEVTTRPWLGSATRGEVLIHLEGAPVEAALAADQLDGAGRCRFEGLTVAEGTKLECTLRMPGLVQVGRAFDAPQPGATVQLTLDATPAQPHAVLLVEEGSGAAVGGIEVVAFWSAGGRRVRTRGRTDADGWAVFRSLPGEPVWFEVRTGRWSSPAVARTLGGPDAVGSNRLARVGASEPERSVPAASQLPNPDDASLGPLGPEVPTTVLLARPAASLSGRILGAGGRALDQPPTGLRVRAVDDLGREHHLRAEVTDEGAYRVEGLPIGALQLLAVAEPANSTTDPLLLQLLPGEDQDRDLLLRDRVGVRGRVVSAASGLPLAGAKVEAHLMVGGAWLPEAVPAVTTDAWGRFASLSVSTTAGAVLVHAQGHDQRALRVEVPLSPGRAATGQGDDLTQQGARLGAPTQRGVVDPDPGGALGGLGPGRTRRNPTPPVLDLGDLVLALEQTATLQLSPCPPNADDWILLQEPPLSFDPTGRLALTASPGPLQVLVQGPGQVPTLVECTLSGAGPWHLEVPAEPADGRLARFHLTGAGGAPFEGASLASTALRIAHLDMDTGVALVQHARPVADGAALIEVRGLPQALLTVTLVHAGREGAPQVVDGRPEGPLEVSIRAGIAQDEVLLVDEEGLPLADFDAWLRPAEHAPPHHAMVSGDGRLHLDPDAPLEELLLADPISRRLARLDSVQPLAEGPTLARTSDRLQLVLRTPDGPLAHMPLLVGLDPHPAIGALALTTNEEGLSPMIRHGAGPLWLHLPAPGVWRSTRRLALPQDPGALLELEVLRTAAVLVRAIPTSGGVTTARAGLVPHLRHLALQQSVSQWVDEGCAPPVGPTDAAGEVLVQGIPEGAYLLELGGASIEVELRHGQPLEVEVLLP